MTETLNLDYKDLAQYGLKFYFQHHEEKFLQGVIYKDSGSKFVRTHEEDVTTKESVIGLIRRYLVGHVNGTTKPVETTAPSWRNGMLTTPQTAIHLRTYDDGHYWFRIYRPDHTVYHQQHLAPTEIDVFFKCLDTYFNEYATTNG